MSDYILNIYFLFVSIIVTSFSVFILRKMLERINFFDFPNHRSTHTRPVPTSAGIVLVPNILLIPYLLSNPWPAPIVLAIFVLFTISLMDDIKSLPVFLRLGFHFFAIAIPLFFLEYINKHININYSFIPVFIVYLFVSIFIVGFINAFNFMDGIDGISGVMVIIIGLGVNILYFVLEGKFDARIICLVGISIGFLFHNWSPARIFLGDSGSIPLGFICGFTLVDLALKGYWLASLILPSYYIIDTLVTLILRINNNMRPWEAHNEHFYQKAVRRGFSHNKVSFLVAAHGMGLILLSVGACFYKNSIYLLILTLIWCIGFLIYLAPPWNESFEK